MSDSIHQRSFTAILPAQGDFWHWAADGEAICWTDGSTLCMHSGLIRLLEHTQADRLPCMHLLLILTATSRSGPAPTARLEEALSLLIRHYHGGTAWTVENLKSLFLKCGRGDPAEKIRILVEGIDLPQTGTLDRAAILDLVSNMPSGVLNGQDSGRSMATVAAEFFEQLGLFRKRLLNFDSHSRTGILSPEKIRGGDQTTGAGRLLEELEKTRRFQSAAHLARRLIPMVSVPLRAGENGLLGVGGVSDLTNRGKPEQLLISELAHDPEFFTLRLAGNEALYLRREAPPEASAGTRFILLDTGIHSWGTPRVLNACIALALTAKAGPGSRHELLLIGTDNARPFKLDSMEQWLKLLETLSPHPDPGPGLSQFLDRTEFGPQDELQLICDPCFLENGTTLEAVKALRRRHSTAIHHSHIDSGHCFTGRRMYGDGFSITFEARLRPEDIDAVIHAPATEEQEQTGQLDPATAIPGFLENRPWPPLYFQVDPSTLKYRSMDGQSGQLVGYTHFNELYYWRYRCTPARLLDRQCPEPLGGKMLVDSRSLCFAHVHGEDDSVWIRHLPLASHGPARPKDIRIKHNFHRRPACEFHATALVLNDGDTVVAAGYHDGGIIASQDLRRITDSRLEFSARPLWGMHRRVRGNHPDRTAVTVPAEETAAFINPAETITRPDRVAVSAASGLPCVRDASGLWWQLDVQDAAGGDCLQWSRCHSPDEQPGALVPLTSAEIPKALRDFVRGMFVAEARGNTQAVFYLDRHGFLHVETPRRQSAEKHWHSLSISLLTDRGPVAWTSSGHYYGNPDQLWGEPMASPGELLHSLGALGKRIVSSAGRH
jgi:hypothetical protein